MFPLDQYYQDMHYNLFPEDELSMLKTLVVELAETPGGRYYIGCYVQKAMEVESMWGRFVAFKEG